MALAAAIPVALAKTVYIRDELYVPLRGGQSTQYRILHKGIRSGTPLELLETNDDSGYSKVRMSDGLEGWLQTQYLQDTPIAQTQLKDVQEKAAELDAEHQKTLLQLQTLESEKDSLSQQLQDTKDKLDTTATALAQLKQLSANVVKINERNKALESERQDMQRRVDSLVAENDQLRNTSMQMWFLRGGGLVLLAIIMGFWFGRRVYNRRSTVWT